MSTLAVLVPAPLHARTGGYEYDRRMIAGLRARGWSVCVLELDSSFPRPTEAARHDAARRLRMLPDGTVVLADGLAFSAMPLEVEHESRRLKLVALVHMPLAAEPAVDRAVAAELEAGERRALAAARLVIVTGAATAAAMAKYEVTGDRVAVVEPGTDRAAVARGSETGPIALLSVGAVTAGKGHELLIRALARMPDRAWQLTCAGSLERAPAVSARVRQLVASERLEDRVSFVGELNEKALRALYARSDVFVLATLYETYGMAVAEALAHGLPVVSTRTGAIPQLISLGDETGGGPAGLLSDPGDAAGMGESLSRVLGDAELRAALTAAARRARLRLPTWDSAVDKMASALTAVSREPVA
jgi:glycosyltransferase involved in cell wall biosynthesis